MLAEMNASAATAAPIVIRKVRSANSNERPPGEAARDEAAGRHGARRRPARNAGAAGDPDAASDGAAAARVGWRRAPISAAATATPRKLTALAARPSRVPPAAVRAPASSGPAVKPA